jgi:orotidine-5'-phosphate decarboxylase
MSVDVLYQKIKQMKNPTVAGLDPDLAYVPRFIKDKNFEEYGKNLEGGAMALLEFNRRLIDELYDIVPALKPQAAYYEAFGSYGVRALEQTIAYAKEKGMYIIADVKRNDIGSTSAAYARAYLGQTDVEGQKLSAFGCDGATVNGYLGTDGIDPFLAECKKGKMIFCLVKTSNPSSGELQDRLIDGRPVYEVMADMVNKWGEQVMGECGYSQVGAVVGATYPEQQKELRALMPRAFFLVPGYGAQGAGAKDIAGAFSKDGSGAIVNSSRGIMCAWQKQKCDEADFAAAARQEALRMRDELACFL